MQITTEEYLRQEARSAANRRPAKIYFRNTKGEAKDGFSLLSCTPGRGPGHEGYNLSLSNWPKSPHLDESEPLRWGIGDQGLTEVIIPFLDRLGAQIVAESEVGLWSAVFSEEPRSDALDLALTSGQPFDVGNVEELADIVKFLLSRDEFTKKKRKLSRLEKSKLLVRDPEFISESLEKLLAVIEANHRVIELGLSILREEGYYPSLQTFLDRESK